MNKETNDDQESAGRSLTGEEDETMAIPADWLAEFEAAARRSLETKILITSGA